MKSISIYAVTRNQNIGQLQKLERQLSGREYFLKMRTWELESMSSLVRELEAHMDEVYALRFFYSFQIPRLGKEFDLLQIKDEQIVNIELKSGAVSDETIRKQLIQNRYYLSVLGRPIYSYTYISSQNRLVRLTNHDHISDASWQQLCGLLKNKSVDYGGKIEDLFQAEMYLISPLTEPLKFLKKEYFLTSQQRDIKRQILKRIRTEHTGYYSFSGLPGTGKTLLLYDIAMKLSQKHKVCMIHCGEAGKKWEILHERLRRIDFWPDNQIKNAMNLEDYSAILVDEAHLLSTEKLELLLECVKEQPVIFSSDVEDMISSKEIDRRGMYRIEHLPGIQIFRLTNRIRANAEVSSFIQNMMHLPAGKSQKGYPHIEVVYANDSIEAEKLIKNYKCQGYQYRKEPYDANDNTTGQEHAEYLAVVLNDQYYYDEEGYLRSNKQGRKEMSDVRKLFHYLNQVKESLALVILENEEVYGRLLNLLQGK